MKARLAPGADLASFCNLATFLLFLLFLFIIILQELQVLRKESLPLQYQKRKQCSGVDTG
jgi:hypothetical protein